MRLIPGKVLFSSSAEISEVCELKAAERLFLLLKLSPPEPLPTHANKGRTRFTNDEEQTRRGGSAFRPLCVKGFAPFNGTQISHLECFAAKAASALQSRLLGEKDEWSGAVMTWRRLQGELERRRAALSAGGSSGAQRVTAQEQEEQKEDRWSEAAERRETSGVRTVDEPGRARRTLERKRKRDDGAGREECKDYSGVENGGGKKTPEGGIGTVSGCGVNGVNFTGEERITPLHSVSDIGATDGVAEGGAERKVTDGKKNNKKKTSLAFISARGSL